MKYLVCVLLALVAVQANAGTTRYAIQEERGIIEGIQDIIEKIKNEINSIIKNIINQIENIFPGAIQQIKDKIEEKIAELKLFIKKLIQEAIEAGKDVSKCIATFEQDIADIQNKVVEGTQTCVQGIVDEAQKLVEEIISKVAAIKAKAEELLNKIKTCTNPICLLQVGKEATDFLATINIKVIVDEIKNIIDEVNGEVFVCIGNQVIILSKGINEIKNNMVECIKQI